MLINQLFRDIYSGCPPPQLLTKTGKNLREKWGKRKEVKKKRGRMEEKREKETNGGNYPYFISLFYIGPYDRQKKVRKKQGLFKKIVKVFPNGHNIYPCNCSKKWRNSYILHVKPKLIKKQVILHGL